MIFLAVSIFATTLIGFGAWAYLAYLFYRENPILFAFAVVMSIFILALAIFEIEDLIANWKLYK